jgi:hypothetical protein
MMLFEHQGGDWLIFDFAPERSKKDAFRVGVRDPIVWQRIVVRVAVKFILGPHLEAFVLEPMRQHKAFAQKDWQRGLALHRQVYYFIKQLHFAGHFMLTPLRPAEGSRRCSSPLARAWLGAGQPRGVPSL